MKIKLYLIIPKIFKNNLVKSGLKRINIIHKLISKIKTKTNIIATTGFTSRELMEVEKGRISLMNNNFYMVGGMGHSAALSLGISLNNKKETICFDGDGSLLMHLGAMATIGFFGKKNFKHVLFNNNAHESVGGQTTNAKKVDFEKLTKSLGYKKYFLISKRSDVLKKISSFLKAKGPVFLEILIEQGSIKNLMRPNDLKSIKIKFMKKI